VTRLALAFLVALSLLAPATALAHHTQPAPDIAKMDYSPIGHLKPGADMPADAGAACDGFFKPLMNGKLFNPSGKWNAYDTNAFEATCLPYRGAGDTSDQDPMGNGGEPKWGFCKADASDQSQYKAGVCPNHQLEYIDYYEATMKEILKDFGVTMHRYQFEHGGSGNTSPGRAINPAAVVPGVDHPDETIVVGAHYDQTIDGPASAWDSAEGHATIIRVAKIMADYWKATGTRPSATVKFIPWDGEESGTFGSLDYATNNVVPDEEFKVRGYWNTDPCAGGYPARRYGSPDRIDLGIQLGDLNEPRVVAFNERAPKLVEQVFEHLDDTIESYPDKPEVFISTAEGGPLGGDIGKDVFLGVDKPIIFSSDWRNFIALGIPFFNPGPEVTGPNSGGNPQGNTLGSAEGVYQFHTPLDSMQTMNRFTGGDPTGLKWSEAWMKGMEMCGHLLGWGMLQPDQGGAQTTTGEVVSYYEALPNEAELGKLVTFDAGGSYQYADKAARTYVAEQQLQFRWDFGDGSPTAYGRKVRHAYKRLGTFRSKLTVTNRRTGEADSMEVPITVAEGQGSDTDPAGQTADSLPPQGSVVACSSTAAMTRARATGKGRKISVDFATTSPNPVVAEVFLGRKRLAMSTKPFTFTAKRKGTYVVRISGTSANGYRDMRSFAFDLRGSKLAARKPFERPDSCELVSLFRLGGPTFSKSQAIALATTQDAVVKVAVRRGKRVVKRFSVAAKANRAARLRLAGRGLRKGEYTFVLTATAGGAKQTERLYARKV
jgi:hypothetical protein